MKKAFPKLIVEDDGATFSASHGFKIKIVVPHHADSLRESAVVAELFRQASAEYQEHLNKVLQRLCLLISHLFFVRVICVGFAAKLLTHAVYSQANWSATYLRKDLAERCAALGLEVTGSHSTLRDRIVQNRLTWAIPEAIPEPEPPQSEAPKKKKKIEPQPPPEQLELSMQEAGWSTVHT